MGKGDKKTRRGKIILGSYGVRRPRKKKDKPETIPLSIGDPILEEIDEFADCIRTGKKPETDGQGALVALALIRAAIDSARTGIPVDLKV